MSSYIAGLWPMGLHRSQPHVANGPSLPKCVCLSLKSLHGLEATATGSVGATLLRESDVPSPSQREESSDSIPSTLSAPPPPMGCSLALKLSMNSHNSPAWHLLQSARASITQEGLGSAELQHKSWRPHNHDNVIWNARCSDTRPAW